MSNYLHHLITLCLLCANIVFASAKTDEQRTVFVNGVSRSYWLYVPDHVSAQAPLVLSLHGTGGHATNKSPFRTNVADQVGCIVVYPQGENILFPVFGATLPGWHSTGEYNGDIDFFKAIIDDVAAHFSIDRKRIYCCGFSNGGMMTYTAACTASNVFAAFASISGYPINEFHLHQSGPRPVPFLHIHGKADDFVRYRHMPVIVDNMVARNGCNPIAKKTRGTGYDKSIYEATEGGFPYVYYEIDNMGHSDFTTQTEDGNSAMTMWKFMSQYSLDSPCDTTLVWQPRIETQGWNPAAHGFTIDKGTTRLDFGGELSNSANQNVYHSLQLRAGSYKLRVKAEDNDDATVTLLLKDIVSRKTIFNKTIGCGNIAIDFSVDKAWAEYKLTILSTSTTTRISDLNIHSNNVATAIHTIKRSDTGREQYYALNGSSINGPARKIYIKRQGERAVKVIR